MSKRAEQFAMTLYTPWSEDGMSRKDNREVIEACIKGYEQAEEDTIRTVKTWLSEIHRVCDITDENGYRIELRNLIASLEKTLEGE